MDYANFIHNLPKFLKNFLKNVQNFLKFFRIFLWFFFFFFQKFTKYYSKQILFSNFRCIFSTIPQFLISLLTFYRVSCKFLKFFFKGLLESLHKVVVKIGQNFYSSSLKKFSSKFRSVFKFFYDTQIIFLKKLIVCDFFYPNFLYFAS